MHDVYLSQIFALVPKIFKLEKCVKHTNTVTELMMSNSQLIAILHQEETMQHASLKLGRLIVL